MFPYQTNLEKRIQKLKKLFSSNLSCKINVQIIYYKNVLMSQHTVTSHLYYNYVNGDHSVTFISWQLYTINLIFLCH